MKYLGFIVLGVCLSACARSKIVSPDGVIGRVKWEAGRDQAITPVEIRRTDWASYHLIRLAGAEKPHVHQRHDVTVTVVKGRVRVHLGDQDFVLGRGDVVYIPHGLEHWAENISRFGASEAHAVFTPPYGGKDSEPVQK